MRDFTYDHLNRETSEEWMSGSTVIRTISYSYNADGQLTSASSPDSAYAYTYDGMGRVTSGEFADTHLLLGGGGAAPGIFARVLDGCMNRRILPANLEGQGHARLCSP